MTPHPAFSMTTLYVRFRVRNVLLKWFSYILIPCAPSILVQIVKGFLGCVSLFRGTQVNRCEPTSPKWSHNLFTIPTRWNGKELNTLREHRMCLHLLRLCLSCASMFSPNMSRIGTFSQILTLEVWRATSWWTAARVVRAEFLDNIYPIKIRDSIEIL